MNKFEVIHTSFRSFAGPLCREAIDRSTGPTLVYDLRAIETNMRNIADAARAATIQPLFAMKSFPHSAVRALAASVLGVLDGVFGTLVSQIRRSIEFRFAIGLVDNIVAKYLATVMKFNLLVAKHY